MGKRSLLHLKTPVLKTNTTERWACLFKGSWSGNWWQVWFSGNNTICSVQFPLRSHTLTCDYIRTDLWHHHQIKALSGCRCFLRAKQTGLWHSRKAGIKQLPGTNCAAFTHTSCDTYSQFARACWANGNDEGWAFNTGFQWGVWTSVFVVFCLYWANQQGFHTSSDPKNFSWPIMG